MKMGLGASIHSRLAGAIIALLVLAAPAQAAETLPPSAATPILTIEGRIAAGNDAAGATFDLALLKSLPAVTLRTTTAWTDGMRSFTGVRLRDLLDRVGAKGEAMTAGAIDDYTVEIPMSDAREHEVIVAYAIDGQSIPPNDKGPLWIVYPFSQEPALQRDFYFARCIWQLRRLTVH